MYEPSSLTLLIDLRIGIGGLCVVVVVVSSSTGVITNLPPWGRAETAQTAKAKIYMQMKSQRECLFVTTGHQ